MAHPNPVYEGAGSDHDDADISQSITRFRGSFVMDHLNELPEARGPGQHKIRRMDFAAAFEEGWNDAGIWKSAVRNFYPSLLGGSEVYWFVEFVATALLCYLSGLIDTTITNFSISQGAAYVGGSNVVLLTLFIMAAGPGSGGHVNPTIIIVRMITGLTGFSRGSHSF